MQYIDNSVIELVLSLVNEILNQNYFAHDNTVFKQIKGLAIVAPASRLFSEIYLQGLEHNEILKILLQNHINAYFRYVDDILIIYNTENTDINNMLTQFNQIYPNLVFTMEHEDNMLINCLDLTIARSDNGFSTSIYRKPTATDTLIHYNSCHPYEQKLAGVNFLENRIIAYPMTEDNQTKEIQMSKKMQMDSNILI
jgi:hypothetical protein